MKVPAVTVAQMKALDAAMMTEYGIDLSIMMENAGRAMAIAVRRFIDGSFKGKPILVLAGRGNNGGGGLVAARHLFNWGADVQVLLSSQLPTFKEMPKKHLEILKRIDVPIHNPKFKMDFSKYHLFVDAFLGYNQKGNPAEPTGTIIRHVNKSGRPIIALDTPTGLDPDSGVPFDPCIRAIQTITLALPKIGLLKETAAKYVGELYLADISVPPSLYSRFGVKSSPFNRDIIVPVNR